MTESMQSVGIRIKELREKQSLTRQDLASYIGRGISEKEVQAWEEQSVFPGFEKFDELTDVLGTSLVICFLEKKDMINRFISCLMCWKESKKSFKKQSYQKDKKTSIA
ncbi:helix-turn-helix transcriptional regulator [Enterococcus faecalis]|nr:helix-turn-helix transcriptional regulator [Enterococcus faecalis]EHS2222527.1 helix-turn-helix transcriptional regulator [Enterococcus faecalis]